MNEMIKLINEMKEWMNEMNEWMNERMNDRLKLDLIRLLKIEFLK